MIIMINDEQLNRTAHKVARSRAVMSHDMGFFFQERATSGACDFSLADAAYGGTLLGSPGSLSASPIT